MKYLLLILLIGCSKIPVGHSCKWESCPYKGISLVQYEDKVLFEIGSDDCEAYWLDIYHIQFPTEEYEQLEERLNP